MKSSSSWMERWANIELNIPTEQVYQVSNLGRIRNRFNKILQGSTIQGYKSLNIRIQKTHRNFYVHKLVAQHFCPHSKAEDFFVIHKDYDKLNNRHDNLKWVNRFELTQHNKTNPAIINKSIPMAAKHYKLNPSKVLMIKQLIRSGKSRPKMIAKLFGITSTQVTRIKKGENWKNVN
jgi:hypothetical protein